MLDGDKLDFAPYIVFFMSGDFKCPVMLYYVNHQDNYFLFIYFTKKNDSSQISQLTKYI